MEWIASLFKLSCPFCGTAVGDCRMACAACAPRLRELEERSPIRTSVGGLDCVSAWDYEDWVQDLIIRQKANPHPIVVRWMAEQLIRHVPEHLKDLPIVWLPGSIFGQIHLVEALALTLRSLGHPLAKRQHLARRIRKTKSQKELTLKERKNRNIRELYRARRTLGSSSAGQGPVILLDDVLTTGSTLLGCKKILEERLGLRVRGALALANTPKRIN